MPKNERQINKAVETFLNKYYDSMSALADLLLLIDEAGEDGPQHMAVTSPLCIDFWHLNRALVTALVTQWDTKDHQAVDKYLTEAVEQAVEMAGACLTLRFHNRLINGEADASSSEQDAQT